MHAELVLSYAAVAVFMIAVIWLLVVVARLSKWWLIATIVFAGLPLLVFGIAHPRLAGKPFLLMVSSVLLGLLALVYSGDLIHDRHPDQSASRSFEQKLFGCSGTDVWKILTRKPEEKIPELLTVSAFDSTPFANNVTIGKMAVRAAAAAYLETTELTKLADRWGVSPDRIKPISIEHNFAVVISHGDLMLVAFRGTDDSEDWVKNFNFVPTKTEWGYVHGGFNDAIEELWPEVIATIRTMRDREQPIWFVGHSLGGAMAVLGAAKLKHEGVEPAGVVTFGQPPLGYGSFTEKITSFLGGPVIRFVNHVDAVVEVQTPLLALSLEHIGKQLYFDTTGRLHEEKPEYMQLLRDSVCAPMIESGAEFKAHGIRRYVKLLQRDRS